MSGWKLVLAWAVCVLVGAIGGYFLGFLLWRLGFELIGSAVALVGAGIGGILAFFAFLRWSTDREMSRSARSRS
jgi:hypothetical protein